MKISRGAWGTLVILLSLLVSGCLRSFLPGKTPISTQILSEGGGCLVVLLPGRFGHPRDFARAEFDRWAREAGLSIDLVAVDAHLGYYRDRSVVDRIRQDVVLPALDRGYQEIWMAGVSLGGLGSLLYARENPDDLTGALSIAPFLGDEELVEGIRAQGGIRHWEPTEEPPSDSLPGLWRWLQSTLPSGEAPALYLAYGTDDEHAAGAEVLRELIPPERVFTASGGHDWPVWEALWRDFLRSGALCSGNPGQGRPSPSAV